MQFIHPSILLETSNRTIQEFMDIIERAGRTCWKSETKRFEQALKYIEDPEFEPSGYKAHRMCHSEPVTLERLMSPNYVRTVRDDEAFRQVTRDFNKRLIKVSHTSVLEHSAITVRIITDRAVSHQLVRHRLAAYSQESQRYVENKGHVMFIIPEDSGLEPGFYKWDDGWHSGMEGEYKTHQSLSEILMDTAEPNGLVQCQFQNINSWPEYGMPRSWVRAMHYAEECYKELRESGVKKQDARSVLPNSTKTEIVATYNIHMWRHVLQKRLHPSAQHDIRRIMGMILDEFMKTPMAILFEDLKK